MSSRDLRANHALRSNREKKGWTQEQVATFLGTNAFTVYRWESGRAFPRPYHQQKLCELFEKNAAELGLLPEHSSITSENAHVSILPVDGFATYWYVPYQRNLFFTGREEILKLLHNWLRSERAGKGGVPLLISGLGGIGKTQIAIEYAYLHASEYSAVFWLSAENTEHITASVLAIAAHMELPECREADQQRVVQAVQHWLSTHGNWLLIWDNLEDPLLLHRFLQSAPRGTVLITSRRHELGTFAQSIEILPMKQEEGIGLLLQRTKLLQPEEMHERIRQLAFSRPQEYAAAKDLVAIMGGLPLALDQARSYLEETGCSLSDYLRHYEEQRSRLLDRRGTIGEEHPQSVSATFMLASQRVADRHPLAADLLQVCALLHAEAIPEEIFTTHNPSLQAQEISIGADPYQFDLAIASLRTFSLIQRHVETRTLSIHRLVQVVLQEGMSEQQRTQWVRRVISTLNALFPEPTDEAWQQCERLLPHVMVCDALFPRQVHDEELTELLLKAANYLRGRARYTQAERIYRRILDIQEQILGSDHLQVSSTLHLLATLYGMQGKYDLAIPLFWRVVHLREQGLGPEHPEIAYPLNNLGNIYKDQGKYAVAESLFWRALRIREQTLGPEHPQMQYPIDGLAHLYLDLGNYAMAEQFYQRALRIQEQAWGPDQRLIAFPLNGLACVYIQLGKYEQAERLLQRALHVQEHTLRCNHPEIAYVLDSLASLYLEQGKYLEAKELYDRAILMWEETLGPDYHELSSPLTGLAHVYVWQRDDEQAERLYRRAWLLKVQALGPEHPHVAFPISGLANLYREQGRYEEAAALYQQALAIREQLLDQQHPEIGHTLHDLAICSQRTGYFTEALSYAWRALLIRSQCLGPSHPKTVATYNLCVTVMHLMRQQINDPDSKQKVGKALYSPLREQRKRRGWSQKYIAALIGVEHFHISRWERGITFPDPDHWQTLCTLFMPAEKEPRRTSGGTV